MEKCIQECVSLSQFRKRLQEKRMECIVLSNDSYGSEVNCFEAAFLVLIIFLLLFLEQLASLLVRLFN